MLLRSLKVIARSTTGTQSARRQSRVCYGPAAKQSKPDSRSLRQILMDRERDRGLLGKRIYGGEDIF
jgi:hypothetical protein